MCGPAYQTRVENGSVTQRFQMGGNGFHLKPGVNFFFGELIPKRLEILRELVPAMTSSIRPIPYVRSF
jgi:hypothetical protein